MVHLEKFGSYRNTLLFFYAVVPTFFYLTPAVVAYGRSYVTLHFFNTFRIDSSVFLVILLGHLYFGCLVVWSLNPGRFNIYKKMRASFVHDLLAIIFLSVHFFVGLGYLSVFSFPAFLLVLASRNIGTFAYIGMTFVCGFQLLYANDRFPIVMLFIIISAKYFPHASWVKLFFGTLFGLFILIFILQPIRSGYLPFTGTFGLQGLGYFFVHLNPIYIGSYVSLNFDFSFSRMLSEMVPFLKSLFGFQSVIEDISREALPGEIVNAGTRLGSNSAMYFNLSGFLLVTISFVSLRLLFSFIKLRLLYGGVIYYLILNAPYFVRRSIGSYLIDLYILIVLAIIVSAWSQFQSKLR